MLFYNGKKPGGYSIESYEPIDVKPEEKSRINNLNMAFTSRNNNSLDISKLNNYYSLYNTVNPAYSKNAINVTKIYTINPANSFKFNQTVIPLNKGQILYQYSKKSNYVLNPINNNYIRNVKQNMLQNANYLNMSHQAIRPKTFSFVPTIKSNPIMKRYIINTNQVMNPINIAQLQKTIMPTNNVNINRIIPIYPTITYRRSKIF